MSAIVETTLRPQAVDQCVRLADNVRTGDIQVPPAPSCSPSLGTARCPPACYHHSAVASIFKLTVPPPPPDPPPPSQLAANNYADFLQNLQEDNPDIKIPDMEVTLAAGS